MALSEAAYFRSQALRCLRLARGTSDDKVGETLKGMADEYEAKAKALDANTND